MCFAIEDKKKFFDFENRIRTMVSDMLVNLHENIANAKVDIKENQKEIFKINKNINEV